MQHSSRNLFTRDPLHLLHDNTYFNGVCFTPASIPAHLIQCPGFIDAGVAWGSAYPLIPTDCPSDTRGQLVSGQGGAGFAPIEV